jgi:tRNA pseudouridine55 synthase
MNGVINFYKPPGMTSAQAVAFIKGLTGEKTGHAGTLDPEAAGVLPILLGKATKINDYLMNQPKQYLAEIAFGTSTDTQDAQGKVLDRSANYPSLESVSNILQLFTGEIQQLPPQYSALKVQGRSAYQLAREGKTAPLIQRTAMIYEIALLTERPSHGFLMRIRSGKGAYIRTLCHDIGQALGCPAHMRFLLREACSGLEIKNAATPDELRIWQQDEFKTDCSWFLDIGRSLADMPRFQVPLELTFQAVNGVPLSKSSITGNRDAEENTKVCLYIDSDLLGIYRIEGELLKVAVMLYEMTH